MAFSFDKPEPIFPPAGPEAPDAPPLIGNPVLARRVPPRGQSRTALYVAAPVLVAVIAGAGLYAVSRMAQPQPLMSEASSTPAPAAASMVAQAPVVAAPPEQVAAAMPAPPATNPLPVREERNVSPATAVHRHTMSRRVSAPAAEDRSAEVNARASMQAAPPPAPSVTAAPPTITPPPPATVAPVSPPAISPSAP